MRRPSQPPGVTSCYKTPRIDRKCTVQQVLSSSQALHPPRCPACGGKHRLSIQLSMTTCESTIPLIILSDLTEHYGPSLQIFLRYQGRISFYFHLPTLLDRMASPDPQEQPHPCLLNAIYLMACYFSSLEYTHANSLVGHEAHFLARAQAALTDSLSLSDRLLDFLRGSSLVATYLFLRGRHLEG